MLYKIESNNNEQPIQLTSQNMQIEYMNNDNEGFESY